MKSIPMMASSLRSFMTKKGCRISFFPIVMGTEYFPMTWSFCPPAALNCFFGPSDVIDVLALIRLNICSLIQQMSAPVSYNIFMGIFITWATKYGLRGRCT